MRNVHDAIADYERRIATGELRFSHGEFADMPESDPDGWVSNFLSDHLPSLDITPHVELYRDAYGRQHERPYSRMEVRPRRPDGLEEFS